PRAGRLGHRSGRLEEEPGFPVGVVERPVSKEPALVACRLGPRGIWPLDASLLVEHPVVCNARDVARLIPRKLFQDLEDRFWVAPTLEHRLATPGAGDSLEDLEVGQGQPRSARDLLDEPDPALRVDQGSLFLAPGSRRQ